MTSVTEIFSVRLKECRLQNGMTQRQAAFRLGISPKTYSHYETGKTQPRPDMLLRIVRLFHESADYLLGFEDL